ncbi:MAG: DUF21 domain-containing protein [Elusimicrobia bacterium]|nr:DUF21 domain-containing protein [Elusimicrobiota bacterium]
MAWVLLVSVFLIGLNALFVLMEFALVKVRSSHIEMLIRRGSARAVGVKELQGRLDDYLAAIQMGITVIALALGWIGEPALARMMGSLLQSLPSPMPIPLLESLAFGLGLLLLSWAHIVFGELIPRSIGLQKAESIALGGVYALRRFSSFLRLPVSFMSYCSRLFLKIFGFKTAAESEPVVSEEEMRILLGETQERGTLPLERLLLLENLFDFGRTKVSEIMVPKDKMAFLSLAKPWAENWDLVRSRRLSRYPLCERDIESVIGMVHVKDLMLRPPESSQELRKIRRDLAEVREGDSLEKLLKYFPDKGIHLAAVRDAQGQLTGFITLEDILEELVGEVHDEFDLPQAWSLMDVLVPQSVSVELQAADSAEAISRLLERLAAACPTLKRDEIFKAVWEREAKFSSAVGHGVAVPHARLAGFDKTLVALGRFVKPVPFPAPDAVPVRLIFLILTPAATPVAQLRVLGRIASLMTNETLRRKLLRAKTAESMLETLRTADTLLAI